MKTQFIALFGSLMLPLFASAAIHADATLDWSGFTISSSTDATAHFEKNITPSNPLYYSGHQFLIYDEAAGCVNHGYGCQLLTPNTSSLFEETASLGSGSNVARATLGDQVTQSTADLATAGSAMATPAGFGRLTTTGEGFFTLRLPYAINVWSDSSAWPLAGDAFADVRLAYVVPGNSFYDVASYAYDSVAVTADQTTAFNKSGVLELQIYSAGPSYAYEFSYYASSYASLHVPPTTPVPEPETYAMLALGVVAIFATKRNRRV